MRDDLPSSAPDVPGAAPRSADTMWGCVALAGVSTLLGWTIPAILALLLAAVFAIKRLSASFAVWIRG